MPRDYVTPFITADNFAAFCDALSDLSNASPDERVAALRLLRVKLPADQYDQIVEAISFPEDFPYSEGYRK
ncbi:MAG: hypothetical protein WCJ93_09535 [Methanomicrobiales archaeon]